MDVACTKWGGGQHWTFTATHLGDDEFGSWLGAPAGAVLRRPGAELRLEATSVQLFTPGAWASPTFNGVGPDGSALRFDIYVDIVTECWYDAGTWRLIDLDLDVVRTRGTGLVEIVDRDEFADHQVALGYPAEVITAAEAAAAAVAAAIERGDEPYATVGPSWLARAFT